MDRHADWQTRLDSGWRKKQDAHARRMMPDFERHADAAWKVQERGAPSPRAYIRLVNAWMTRVRARIARMMGPHADATPTEDEQRRQMELFLVKLRSPGALPPPPDPADIASVGAPAVKQAARASRQGLLVAGYPRVELERRMVQSGAAPGTSLVGIDIAPTDADRLTLRTWAKDGTDLIKTVEQDLVAGLDRYIVEALREGRYDLGTIVQERLGVSQRHAQFIARDQIAKLNAAVTQGTQRAAGMTMYKWRSSRDERTRPMHRALDGTVHSWDDPPVTAENGATNHPGEDYQCRCNAIPVVPDEPSKPAASPASPMPDEPPVPVAQPAAPTSVAPPRVNDDGSTTYFSNGVETTVPRVLRPFVVAGHSKINADISAWVRENDWRAKLRAIDTYQNLAAPIRAAMDADVRHAVMREHGTDTKIRLYRAMRPGDDPLDMGGKSLSANKGRMGAIQAFEVDASDIMLHYGQNDSSLASKAFAHEQEVILKPGAKPRPVAMD